MKERIERIKKFRDDTEWKQYHSLANLSKAILIEASELLGNFLWNEVYYDKENVL